MNVGGLFSGIGGLELGFQREGFKIQWLVEIEPYATQILRKRFSNTPIYGDITKINFRNLPRVQILLGGFPCQDISDAGKKAGIEGDKSSLWKQYLRAICEIRPRYAIIENVSALLNRGIDTILLDLSRIGYACQWNIIFASQIGAPHRRARIFLIAYPDSTGDPQKRLQRLPQPIRQTMPLNRPIQYKIWKPSRNTQRRQTKS